jgi:aromatic ring-opening dioxygenase catalytic subunit (LigB family)
MLASVELGSALIKVAEEGVLVIGSGLMVRSFAALHSVDPGFSTGNLLTFTVQRSDNHLADQLFQALHQVGVGGVGVDEVLDVAAPLQQADPV